jgi:hypothetical protein
MRNRSNAIWEFGSRIRKYLHPLCAQHTRRHDRERGEEDEREKPFWEHGAHCKAAREGKSARMSEPGFGAISGINEMVCSISFIQKISEIMVQTIIFRKRLTLPFYICILVVAVMGTCSQLRGKSFELRVGAHRRRCSVRSFIEKSR